MEKFRVKVDKNARRDFDKIHKPGHKASIKKLETITEELIEHTLPLEWASPSNSKIIYRAIGADVSIKKIGLFMKL